MSEPFQCAFCESTNIEYWEDKAVWYSVFDIEGNEVRIGKQTDEDIIECGLVCTDCLKEQPDFDYIPQFLR